MIKGLSHITFVVKNLECSTLFFKNIFGAEEIYSSGDKTFSLSKEKYFLVNELWICIMESETTIERTYHHIAFNIQENEFDDYMKKIKDIGAEIRPERPRVIGEGRSIYFYDFDNNLFELHTGSLDERLHRYSQDNYR